MSDSNLAVNFQNTELQCLKDAGLIKDFDPSKTKYDSEKNLMSYSYTSMAPIKRIPYSCVGFNFGKFKTRLPRKLKKKLKRM
jgi:hypothetical protein